MSKANIEILVNRDGAPVKETIEAYIIGGLAVHRGTGYQTGWTITHIHSGMALFRGIKTHILARKFAADLGEILDWSQLRDALTISADSPERARILELAKSYGVFRGGHNANNHS